MSLVVSGGLTVVAVLLAMAFYTLAERKLLASAQSRRGPNVVGFWGLLQPMADGVKLGMKEFMVPGNTRSTIFQIAPMGGLVLAFTAWSFMPWNPRNYMMESDYSLLYVLGLSALGVYALVGAGWSSYSSYALLGALSAVSQLMSYEMALSLMLLPMMMCAGSLNMSEMVSAQHSTISYCMPFAPLFLMFLIIMLAETNSTPFDLPEAEAELVAGFNVEYSAMAFAMFFLAEYSNMLLMAALLTVCFFGGFHGYDWSIFSFDSVKYMGFETNDMSFSHTLSWNPFSTFIIGWIFFVMMSCVLPRYSYDQLCAIGWRVLLMLSMGFLFFYIGMFYMFDLSMYSQDYVWDLLDSKYQAVMYKEFFSFKN